MEGYQGRETLCKSTSQAIDLLPFVWYTKKFSSSQYTQQYGAVEARYKDEGADLIPIHTEKFSSACGVHLREKTTYLLQGRCRQTKQGKHGGQRRGKSVNKGRSRGRCWLKGWPAGQERGREWKKGGRDRGGGREGKESRDDIRSC